MASVPTLRPVYGDNPITFVSKSNIAGSAKGPYSQWTAADDAKAQALVKRQSGAVSTSLAQQIAERNALKVARAKAITESSKAKLEAEKFIIKQENDLLKLYRDTSKRVEKNEKW